MLVFVLCFVYYQYWQTSRDAMLLKCVSNAFLLLFDMLVLALALCWCLLVMLIINIGRLCIILVLLLTSKNSVVRQ